MARAGLITNTINVGIMVQADWENHEFNSNISPNIRRLFDFLVQFVKVVKKNIDQKTNTLGSTHSESEHHRRVKINKRLGDADNGIQE